MRQYYLCDPATQAISGPHVFNEVLDQAQKGLITPEWFVAEPGAEQFLVLGECLELNEILFRGGLVPVDPPPATVIKLKGLPPKSRNEELYSAPNLADHHAEFAKVVEKARLAPRPKPPTPSADKPAFRAPHLEDSGLNSENVLRVAREDMARVLKNRDAQNFNPPTYWQSPAGQRMHTFLYGTCCILIFLFILIIVLSFLGGGIIDIGTLAAIGLLGFLLIGGLAGIVFLLMS